MYFDWMEITYLGHASFKIKTRTAVVVIDPYDEAIGKYPKDVEADLVLVSHDHSDHNNVAVLKGHPFVINGPGEYEVKNISIIGVATYHDDKKGEERGSNTVFVVEAEGVRLCHLGDLGHKLSDGQLSDIGAIDVVMVPVGGVYTIDAKTAAEVVKQVDPWIAIPMHYGVSDKLKLASVDDFLKEMGTAGEAQPKLVVTAEKLPSEMQVVVLEKK